MYTSVLVDAFSLSSRSAKAAAAAGSKRKG